MIQIKHEETYESKDLKCPYCGNFISGSWEIEFNDNTIEIECDCGKKFFGSESVIRNFKGRADCELNKEEHQYVEYSDGWQKCKVCGNLEMEKSK